MHNAPSQETGRDALSDLDDSEALEPLRPTISKFYADALFDRYKVPLIHRARVIQEATGLAYNAAYRRTRGKVGWTLDELAKVAEALGGDVDEFLLDSALLGATSATFINEGWRARCHIWLGPRVDGKSASGISAWQQDGEWIVSPSGTAVPAQCFEVKRLLIAPTLAMSVRVAVLDDQPEMAEAVCSYLEAAGFQGNAFQTPNALIDAVLQQKYDAYILDWLIGSDNVRELIMKLREIDRGCPIALLTGQGDSGEVAAAIADMFASLGIPYFTKGGSSRVIVATLQRLIAERRKSPQT
jgi:CheY-like chemotaxis protein